MSDIFNLIKKRNYIFLLSFSLIITENYFFLWNKRFFVHPSYLFFNSLFLFIFSYIFFFVIINLTNKFIKESEIIKLILTILFSFIIVKLIEILLFYSNVITLSFIFENFFSYFISINIIILFLKKLTPYLLVFILLFYFLKNKIVIIQKFLFSFSLIFLIIMIYSLSQRYLNYQKVDLKPLNNISKKKVVWIILDEFDPSIAFSDKIELVNFNLLKEKSITLKNTYSPSSHTLESIPSIFMSRDVKEIRYSNNKVYLRDNLENKEVELNYKNTFLSTLNKNNLNFKLYSEVLPYCFILELERNCEVKKNKLKNYFNGIISSYTPLSYLIKIKNKFQNFKKLKLSEIQNFNKSYKIDKNFLLSKKLNFNIEKFENELLSDTNFIFLHLFLPKENVDASNYVKKFYKTNFDTDYNNYLMMLNYTDLIIKGINELVNKYDDKEIMLIISSDHWYRKLSKEVKPSLFISKIFSDDNKVKNEKKIMNIFIPKLIMKYLNNEIKNHSEINEYVNSLENINLKFIRNNLNKDKNLNNF